MGIRGGGWWVSCADRETAGPAAAPAQCSSGCPRPHRLPLPHSIPEQRRPTLHKVHRRAQISPSLSGRPSQPLGRQVHNLDKAQIDLLIYIMVFQVASRKNLFFELHEYLLFSIFRSIYGRWMLYVDHGRSGALPPVCLS